MTEQLCVFEALHLGLVPFISLGYGNGEWDGIRFIWWRETREKDEQEYSLSKWKSGGSVNEMFRFIVIFSEFST